MRIYLYKIIIATIALIIVFEFTIGRKFNEINEITNNFLSKEGRKEMVASVKSEMEKAIKKENYLTVDERILINKFISKIKNELSLTNSN
jgi:DNA integrity scanning protein DisA with diadenylate cyclase activity|tara:strand:+ start:313 stop:582 length:270 start_codon:yes stop_codon:yes gene_type:complete